MSFICYFAAVATGLNRGLATSRRVSSSFEVCGQRVADDEVTIDAGNNSRHQFELLQASVHEHRNPFQGVL